MPLGISSFINQMATVVMTAVINNMLAAYGASSAYGADIPLAVMGITLKVNQIFLFVVVGIATGAQPIIGFNRGARNYHRVMEALRICVLGAVTAAAVAFIVFQFAPMSIVVAVRGGKRPVQRVCRKKLPDSSCCCAFSTGFRPWPASSFRRSSGRLRR